MDQKFIFNPYETHSLGGFDIESFNVSHDAIDYITCICNHRKFLIIIMEDIELRINRIM